MMKICKEENISGPSVSVVLPPPDFKPPNIIEKGSKVKMTMIMMMMMMTIVVVMIMRMYLFHVGIRLQRRMINGKVILIMNEDYKYLSLRQCQQRMINIR